MAGEQVYIARLGAWIARALGEVGELAAGLDTDGFGFQMPDAVVADPAVQSAGTTLADAGSALAGGADELDAALAGGDETALASALVHLLEELARYVAAVVRFVDRIDTAAAALPAPDRDAVQVFGLVMAQRTFGYVVITTLERQFPRLLYLFKLLGLVEWRVVEATGQLHEPRHVRKELHLERIKDLIRDPAAHLAAVHGWGTAEFDPAELMDGALAFYPEETAIDRGKVGDDAFLEIGPFRWGRESSVTPPGLMLDFSAGIAHSFDQRVLVNDTWGLDFRSSIALSGGAIFRLRPPFAFSVAPKAGTIGGAIAFQVNRNPAARGFTIIGGNDLVRLTADDVGIGAELTIGASTTGQVTIDPGVSVDLKGLTLSLGSKGSDGFLASLLAGANVRGTFDLGLGWTLRHGLVVRAAGGLEIAIPIHQNLGVVRLDTLYLIVKIREDASLALEASAGITGLLGPVTAVVERMGVEATLAFSSSADAKLGPVDLGLRFKPPTGVGLAVDAGIVKGGGFLRFDPDHGEYAGALELEFADFLALKAIGLITTRMPDGSSGFSLLIIITAEFPGGLQLGYGFTLLAVGGLLGLNRTMRLDALAEGVRTGAIESVMFPRDVVANAPRILSDLKAFFPPQQGTFLIGPMAKIGWGTPTLISVAVGIVIEIPGNIAIVGVIKVALPTEDEAILLLQVNFIGAIEFDKKRIWFFASLFESRVLALTIDGELGLLVAYGDEPNFVLTVGGFHPAFVAPPLPFPSPRRVAINILNTDNARIAVSGYFAVTSNTAQFGAAAELYFGFSAFSVQGHIGFDALFRFSPFSFIIEVSASVSLKAFGVGLFSISLRFSLEGPTPWRARGTGSISVLFFEISADFDITWGEERDTTLPSIPVLPLLAAELAKPECWRTQSLTGGKPLVILRVLPEAERELVLHPLGTLFVVQRAVPLDIRLDKVGAQTVSDVSRCTIEVASAGIAKRSDPEDRFALAQFQDMDDAAKLSRPAFEREHAGVELGSDGTALASQRVTRRSTRYEEIVIDPIIREAPRPPRLTTYNTTLFKHFLQGSSVSRSPLSSAEATLRQPFAETIQVTGDAYVIASTRDNTAAGPTFSSHAQARDYLAGQLAEDPNVADSLHILPVMEVAA